MTTDYNILGRHSTWVVSKTMQCWCRKPILRAMRIFDEHQLRLWFWLWTQKYSCTEWDWEPQDQISNSLAHTVSGYHFNNMSLWTNYLCDHEVISVIWSWYDYDRSWMTCVHLLYFVAMLAIASSLDIWLPDLWPSHFSQNNRYSQPTRFRLSGALVSGVLHPSMFLSC